MFDDTSSKVIGQTAAKSKATKSKTGASITEPKLLDPGGHPHSGLEDFQTHLARFCARNRPFASGMPISDLITREEPPLNREKTAELQRLEVHRNALYREH